MKTYNINHFKTYKWAGSGPLLGPTAPKLMPLGAAVNKEMPKGAT